MGGKGSSDEVISSSVSSRPFSSASMQSEDTHYYIKKLLMVKVFYKKGKSNRSNNLHLMFVTYEGSMMKNFQSAPEISNQTGFLQIKKDILN